MKSSTIFLAGLLLLALTHFSNAQTPFIGVKVTSVTDTLRGSVGEVERDVVGNLFVADFAERVWKISPSGELSVFANTMYGSSGNTLDSRGHLYQSQFYGNSIVQINRYNGEITEVAHDGLAGPVGITFKGKDLYVCNCNNNTIGRVREGQTKAEVFAQSSLLNCPNGIISGRDGNIYVVNFNDPNVVRIDTAGNASVFVKLPAQTGGHIAEYRGNYYITSFSSHKIFKVSFDGKITAFAGTGTPGIKNGEGSQAQFSFPNGIAVGTGGLYVNDLLGRGTPNPRTVVRKVAFPDFSAMLTQSLQSGGLPAVEKVYREYKAHPLFKNDNTEAEMNFYAYGAMNRGQVDVAIGLFQLNTESYPQSFNAWDSLAEGYMVKGDKKNARKYYKKSLELNPQNTNATDKLKELGE